jgi:hypothetical protein
VTEAWITVEAPTWSGFAVASANVLLGSISGSLSIRHTALQPSPSTVLPSSHRSPKSSIPLPHVVEKVAVST